MPAGTGSGNSCKETDTLVNRGKWHTLKKVEARGSYILSVAVFSISRESVITISPDTCCIAYILTCSVQGSVETGKITSCAKLIYYVYVQGVASERLVAFKGIL